MCRSPTSSPRNGCCSAAALARGARNVQVREQDHRHHGEGGRLIDTASGQARQGFIYTPHCAASKFGVVGITRSLAKEVAKEAIAVSAFCPGVITGQTINIDRGLIMS